MAGALSADDQLLGEKMDYYCSSSEDEYESCDEEKVESQQAKAVPESAKPDISAYSGRATNTGPKGVVADWRRFKQLETEKRLDQEKELLELQKKLSITCRSHLDDEKEKNEDDELLKELEGLDDDFIKEYQQKRLEEMRRIFRIQWSWATGDNFTQLAKLMPSSINIPPPLLADKQFGGWLIPDPGFDIARSYSPVAVYREIPQYNSITDLHSAEEFLEATENTHPFTTVIVHVYEESAEGVPALLVYKKGLLIGNLVALRDDLGEDFFADDVENILNQQSLLPPKCLPEQLVASC